MNITKRVYNVNQINTEVEAKNKPYAIKRIGSKLYHIIYKELGKMIKTVSSKFTKRTTNIFLALFFAASQLVIPASAFAATGGPSGLSAPVSDGGVTPTLYEDNEYPGGNVECSQLGYDKSSGRNDYNGSFADAWPTGISVTTDGTYVDWVSTFGIGAVIVKGGPNANVYEYDPASTSDNDLASPININNTNPYGLSNLTFCWDEAAPVIEFGSIRVNKKIDLGQGYVDDNPSNYGFLWGLDLETPSTQMGTSQEDVPVGPHAVTENDVAGYEFTGWYHTYNEQYSCREPESPSLPSDVIVRKDEIIEVTLCNKKTETPEPKLGKIRGFKFEDMNGNGKFDKDQDEKKISGWKIHIDKDLDGEFDDFKLTNQDGGYAFRDLPAGTYRVCEEQRDGWEQTYPAGGACHEIILGEGEDHKGVKFGNHKLKENPEPTYGSITVIKDADPNNAQDFHFTIKKKAKCDDHVAVSALANVPCLTDVAGFNLDDDSDPVLDNTEMTSGLTPGYYVITEDPTSGWTLDDINCEAEEWYRKGDTGNTVTVKLLGTENIKCTFTNVKDANPVVPEEPQNPTVPQVLGDVDVKESFVPQTLSTSTLANTGEKDAARGSVFAMTIAGAALATLFTRRKEAKE